MKANGKQSTLFPGTACHLSTQSSVCPVESYNPPCKPAPSWRPLPPEHTDHRCHSSDSSPILTFHPSVSHRNSTLSTVCFWAWVIRTNPPGFLENSSVDYSPALSFPTIHCRSAPSPLALHPTILLLHRDSIARRRGSSWIPSTREEKQKGHKL